MSRRLSDQIGQTAAFFVSVSSGNRLVCDPPRQAGMLPPSFGRSGQADWGGRHYVYLERLHNNYMMLW